MPQARARGLARHGRLKKRSPSAFILQLLGIATAVVLVAGVSVGGVVAYGFASQVSGNAVDIHSGQAVAPPPGVGAYPGGFNVLLVGSDTGEGQGALGEGRSGTLNDVNILVHVSADHSSATAISFPRDMVLPHPRCSKGGSSPGLARSL